MVATEPIRSTVNEPPETPHRLDVYTVGSKYELTAQSPISHREQTLISCARSVADKFELDDKENTIEKISKFESPEKWAIYNEQISASLTSSSVLQYSHSLLALRVLLDAFLYKLGYRAIEWTAEETMEWEQRKQATGRTRGQTIKESEAYLLQSGFTESELSALFSVSNRTLMNSAAHQMEMRGMVAGLKWLDTEDTPQSAIEKAFEFVCGMKMKDVNPKSKDIVTVKGIARIPKRDQWMFEEEVGTWE